MSETTIRRDFDKLEQQGFLTKTYGGAVLNETLLPKTFSEVQNDKRTSDEKMVASIATNLIKDGEAIFLSGGAISEYIAQQLGTFSDITVLTNDIAVAANLRDAQVSRIIVIGGQLQDAGTQLAGEISEICLEHVFVDKAFLNMQGVNIKIGFTVSSFSASLLCKKVASIANEVIVMADHTKFDYAALSKVGPLTMAQMIVTNQSIDDSYKRYCFENNIKLYTAFELL